MMPSSTPSQHRRPSNGMESRDSKHVLSQSDLSVIEAWGEDGPVEIPPKREKTKSHNNNDRMDPGDDQPSSSKKKMTSFNEASEGYYIKEDATTTDRDFGSDKVAVPPTTDDPDGNETYPLTRNSSAAYAKNDGDDEYEEEEEELLNDTFTFLMTAWYPFESYCCSAQERTKTHEEYVKGQEEESEFELAPSTATNNNNERDPDRFYLPFWVGSFVIGSQLFIYAVVIINVFQGDIPPNADLILRLAEIFAVIVTLYTQADFIDGIFLLSERWKAFKDISGPVKFNLSAVCRILAGNVGILATFLLVMYSTEVVDLLLNFTAMEFVATLDDSAFELAAKGFLGITLETKCNQIREFRYHRRHTQKSRIIRCLVYLFYILLVIAGFITIVYLQTARSVGIENEVYVQFDDTDLPELFGISGVYKGCKDFNTEQTGVIGYIDVSLTCPDFSGTDNDSKMLPASSFVYCKKDLDGWVFLHSATQTPCTKGNYAVRSFLDDDSIPLNRFDILTHSKANWVVDRPDIGGEALLKEVVIDSVLSFQSEFVYCAEDGLIRSDKDGPQRVYYPLPDGGEYYPTFHGKYSEADGKNYRDVFGQVFRPLFVRKVIPQERLYSVVFFDGLRWNRVHLNPLQFAYNTTKIDECDLVADPDCWIVFNKYLHTETAWRANFTVVLFDAISDPMMFLSSADTGAPTDKLLWYEARVLMDSGRVIPGKLYEGEADNNNDDYGYGGGEAQVNPYGFKCKLTFNLACSDDETTLIIEFNTDQFPEENSILVFYGQSEADIEKLEVANSVIAQSLRTGFAIPDNGLTDLRFVGFEEPHLFASCVPKNDTCIQVVVTDSEGDGLNGGEFTLAYDLAEGRTSFRGVFSCLLYQFGSGCKNMTRPQPTDCSYSQIFGRESVNSTVVGGTYPDVVTGETLADVPSWTDILDWEYFYDFFIGNESDKNPSYQDVFTEDPTVPATFNTFVPTFELFCDDSNNEIGIEFQVTTDPYPEETQLFAFFGQSMDDVSDLSVTNEMISSYLTGEFEMSGDTLTFFSFSWEGTTHRYGSCVPLDGCIQVVLLDLEEDGFNYPGEYVVAFGDETVVGNDYGWVCRTYQFGAGCTNPDPPADCSLDAVNAFIASTPLNIVEVNF